MGDYLRDLKVERRPAAALKPYQNNPRTHSKKQIRQIVDSIKAFGFTNPVLIDDADGVIAGHGRLEAAKFLEIDEVPTIRLSSMTDAQKRAYIIADNKLAENAGWDKGILAIELQGLIEVDFNVELTGFEMGEIDAVLDTDGSAPDEADVLPAPEIDRPTITQIGDLWALGRHRLVCGDALNQTTYKALLGAKKAQMVFTDPPYNVPIQGHVCGKGRVQHEDFVMAAGEMTPDEFVAFLRRAIETMVAVSKDGAIHFLCMDWRHLGEFLNASDGLYGEFKNLCVWNKTNGGMGSLYRSKHELVFVFKVGSAAHINNVALGVHGRNRTNVWDYAGVNTLKADRADELTMHPTVKPVAMVADAIRDCSRRNGLVLDPFAGSGTTLIACEQTGRRGVGIELDSRYCDVIVRRWQALTGEPAVHEATGKTFDRLAAERLEEGAGAQYGEEDTNG